MNRKIIIFVFSLMVAVVFASSMFFVVDEEEQAVISQFGEPVRVVNGSGLKAKIPFIQKAISFTTGIQKISLKDNSFGLDSGEFVFDAEVDYRIENPMLYYRTVENKMNFENVFSDMLESVIKQLAAENKINPNKKLLAVAIKNQLNKNIREFGVEIIDFRFLNADHAKSLTDSNTKIIISLNDYLNKTINRSC